MPMQFAAARPGYKPDGGKTFAEIHNIMSEARHKHHFMPLPWGDDGYPRRIQTRYAKRESAGTGRVETR